MYMLILPFIEELTQQQIYSSCYKLNADDLFAWWRSLLDAFEGSNVDTPNF